MKGKEGMFEGKNYAKPQPSSKWSIVRFKRKRPPRVYPEYPRYSEKIVLKFFYISFKVNEKG